MLCLTLKPGQRLQIGEAVIQIKPDNEGRFSVRVDADRSIPVRRIQNEPEPVEAEKPDPPPPVAFSSKDVIAAMKERNANRGTK